MESNMSTNAFSVKEINGIGMLCLKKNFMMCTNDLMNRDKIIGCLDNFEKNRSIKIIALIGAPDSKGREEYLAFFDEALKSESGLLGIHRMLNVTNQLIMKIVNLEKFVIYANSGIVLSHFFNIGLACDYRILENATRIQNPCLELGMIQKGGGAYFLSRILGIPKAYKLLLSSMNLKAVEAQKIGIIDEIAQINQLEETVCKAAQRFMEIRPTALAGIKRMVNYQYRDLNDYMEYENDEFLKIISKIQIIRDREAKGTIYD